MAYFFLSLLMILCGGILSLLFVNRFILMRAVAVVFMAAGSATGLIQSVKVLFGEAAVQSRLSYVNAFPFAFRIDSLSAFFLTAIFAVSLSAVIYSFHYMDRPEKRLRTAGCYLFTGMLIVAMALVVTADNIVSFIISWELMSLSSFFLVIYDYESKENREAGYLYAVYSQVGALFIIAAFSVLYARTGQFGFADAALLADGMKFLVFVLAFIGFGSKAGVFPFHAWLPHAHPAAPSHISAIMSGVMIKTGIYGIVRLYSVLAFSSPLIGQIVLVAGIVSGILGVVYALGQHDLKRLLAYHSVENIGIILIGIGMGMIGAAAGQPVVAVLGFGGGLLHVLNHAVFKSLLFMGAGMVLHQTGTRAIDRLGGLIKRMRITGTTFLIGSLAISGLPPFNGFVSEFLIYIGGFKGLAMETFDFAFCLLAIISLAIIGGLALACFTKVVGVVFLGEPRNQAIRTASEKGPAMLAPMIVLAAACLIIGVFPAIFMTMALKAVDAVVTFDPIPLGNFMPVSTHITRGATIFLALLVIVWALRAIVYRNKTVTHAGTWGCGFSRPTVKMQYTGTSYAASILAFFKPVAPLKEMHPPIRGRFPENTTYHSHIEDIAESNVRRLIVAPVLFLFDQLRWLQHGDIHLYIGYILLAIVVVLFFV